MGYVQLSGLGAAPTLRVLSSPFKPVVKPVPTVKSIVAAMPIKPLSTFRPISGAGQQVVRNVAARPMIPALRSFSRAKSPVEREKVDQALPGRMPPYIAPIYNVTHARPVYAKSGSVWKNTQVQVQVGPDKNRVLPPDVYTARGETLTITEPTPTAPITFATSPEEPTRKEATASTGAASAPWLKIDPVEVNLPETKDSGGEILFAGFSPVLWVGLGLLALGMLSGGKKRKR